MLDRSAAPRLGYSIAAAARLTGLSTDSIRSWERRYGLIRPERDRAGFRVYSEAEIARLQLARRATALGHPIRKIAALDDDAIAVLAGASQTDGASGGEPSSRAIVEGLLDALHDADRQRLKRTIGTAATLMDPRELVLRVFVPLLHRVGTLWQERKLSIWQEHLLSDLIASTAGSIARAGEPAPSGTGMLLGTPPHELHAFGTAFAAMLASSRGYRVDNLGASVPASELLAAAKRLNARYVVIGITGVSGASSELAAYLHELDRKSQLQAEIWVGGHVAGDLVRLVKGRRLRAVSTLEEFASAIGYPAFDAGIVSSIGFADHS